MNDISKLLAHITLVHKLLRLMPHRWLVVTLSYNSMAQRPSLDVRSAYALVNLLNDLLGLFVGQAPQVWPRERTPIQYSIHERVPCCLGLYLDSLDLVLKQRSMRQILYDGCHPRWSGLLIYGHYHCALYGWLIHDAYLDVARVQSAGCHIR